VEGVAGEVEVQLSSLSPLGGDPPSGESLQSHI